MMNKFRTYIDTYCDDDISFGESCESGQFQPIFVVGAPRSRTTVLGRSLAEHTQITGLERESIFFLHLFDMYKNLYYSNYGTFGDIMTNDQILFEMRKFADGIINRVMETNGSGKYFCDHTPWYGNITPFLKALYPDSKFIHIVRGREDVIKSLKMSYQSGREWAGKNYEDRLALWENMVQNCRREMNNLHYLEVSSEDVVNQPEDFFRNILEFLDLEFEENVLSRLREKHVMNSVQNDIQKIIP